MNSQYCQNLYVITNITVANNLLFSNELINILVFLELYVINLYECVKSNANIFEEVMSKSKNGTAHKNFIRTEFSKFTFF